ncbi:MAG: tRNA (adenosine(37)-N6)-threonylcarbamoyltransferase complex ATPase subunit type 1 TsaE, partial [Sphingobium sp.]
MRNLGAKLGVIAKAGDVIALKGGLGAGKTTLARGLLCALGLEEDAPSPSF